MLKQLKNKLNMSYSRYGAAITTGLIVAMSSDAAHATGTTTNFSTISNNIGTSIASLPGMVTGLAYLVGILLAVLGILKIKDHVENPTNTPLKDGAVRLAAGGALFALPIVTEAMFETINNGETATAAQVSQLNKVVFNVQ